jgi:hypothetical protein
MTVRSVGVIMCLSHRARQIMDNEPVAQKKWAADLGITRPCSAVKSMGSSTAQYKRAAIGESLAGIAVTLWRQHTDDVARGCLQLQFVNCQLPSGNAVSSRTVCGVGRCTVRRESQRTNYVVTNGEFPGTGNVGCRLRLGRGCGHGEDGRGEKKGVTLFHVNYPFNVYCSIF